MHIPKQWNGILLSQNCSFKVSNTLEHSALRLPTTYVYNQVCYLKRMWTHIHDEQSSSIDDNINKWAVQFLQVNWLMKEKIIWVSLYFHCHCVKHSQIILLGKANTEIHVKKISQSENVHFHTPDRLHVLHSPCCHSTMPFVIYWTFSKYWFYNLNKCRPIIILASQ